MCNLSVNIKSEEKSYPIIIDNSDISTLREKILSFVDGKKILVVVSEKVYKLYSKKLGLVHPHPLLRVPSLTPHPNFSLSITSQAEILPSVTRVEGKTKTSNKGEKDIATFVLKDGEKEKNFKNYQKITKLALKMKLTRKDAIVAIGGGVVGDLTGFVASTYMRGIDFIQVPTTLLACVDSSVGGKVAIDTDFGKNLVGAFYQPKAVLINTNFLKTLDEKQFKTGLGEVVKYSFIEKSCKCDEELNLTNFLSENTEKILAYDNKTIAKLIEICVKLKISVVEKDEKECGLRQILNFGHTYGHAIEKITKYKKYTHGEAIVEGINFVFELAEKKGFIDKNYKFFADDVIKKFGFLEIQKFPTSKMIENMKNDKKTTSEKIVFVLPTDYSTVGIYEFSPEELQG